MKDYILGSHNSWSFLPPKHWLVKPFAFMARCQSKSIIQQYRLGVRCFDLRIRVDKKDCPHIYHGLVEYDISESEIYEYLAMLDSFGDCYVRVVHEVRTKKQYTQEAVNGFIKFCDWYRTSFPNITFWCGRNLYNWQVDYQFENEPSCEEKYSSVCKPRLIDDWWPWLFAKRNNRKIFEEGTDKDILLVDYVNIK